MKSPGYPALRWPALIPGLMLVLTLGLAGPAQAQQSARDHLLVAPNPHIDGPSDPAGPLLAAQGPEPRHITPAQLHDQPAASLRVIYYRGSLVQGGHGLGLPDPAGIVQLTPYLRRQEGLTVVVLNLCDDPKGAADFWAERWDNASIGGHAGEWIIAAPAAGIECEADDFATRAISALDSPSENWLRNLRMAGLQVKTSPATDPASALQSVRDDVIVVSALRGRRDTAAIVARDITPATPAANGPGLGAPPDIRDRRAYPTRPGYPQPSVIVGHPDPDPVTSSSEADRPPLGMDPIARRQLKQQDPAGFARLLESGGLDPAAERVAEAIQTELARMGCYAGQIDGIWGAASTSAVQRYFDKSRGQPVSNSAEIALYRQIIANDEVACDPLPAASSSPLRAGTGTGNQRIRSTPTRTGTEPASRPAAPPAEATQPARGASPPAISPNFGGTGLFR